MNAVTKIEERQGGEVVQHADRLLGVIERASRDPGTDIEKLERLFALRERYEAREAKIEYDCALAEMQPKLPVITERGHIIIKEKGTDNVIQDTTFARWEDINEAIRPLLSDYGFALTFRNGLAPDGKVRVTTVLKHRSGHEEETHFDLPHDSSGSKNAVQAVGSSTSYAKRYGTLSILNITTRGEDDDGHSSIPPQIIEQDTPNSPAKPDKKPLAPGVHTSRTSLTNAIRKLKADGGRCEDEDAFEALLERHKADIDQLRADNHQWWTATDFENVPAWIARRRSELASSYRMLLDKLQLCETPIQLSAFFDEHEPVIDALDDGDRRRFDEEYEARDAAIKTMMQRN